MNEFKDMLIYLRKRDGLSQLQLGQKLGLSKSAISMYEQGKRKPSYEVLEAVADVFNVTISFLMGKAEISPDYPGVRSIPRTVLKPRLGTIACGKPVLAVEEAEQWDSVPEGIDCDFTLECNGDSMINARIFPGDIVYIKARPMVENGEIAAVLIGEETTLKKVYYNNGSDRIVLQPCNPMYSDMVYMGADLDEIKILGKAVAFLSKVRV